MTAADLHLLAGQLSGDLFTDSTQRIVYATDASAYREMPAAVAVPKTVDDLKKLIAFANQYKTSLIPRTAGTSLAGQVVGSGIVVDVSKHFTKILEINPSGERWVRVQPGVIRDELNQALKPYGLYFGPETSTANRAMIGGMVGNNSCGSNSVVYRATREHTVSVKVLLADGSEAEFGNMSGWEFTKAVGEASRKNGLASPKNDTLADKILLKTNAILADPANQAEIRRNFPKKSIERRNTGYALDALLDMEPFSAGGEPFNLAKFIAGSEGTLCFMTEIKLNIVPLPPKESGLVCVHCHSIDESLRATLVALNYGPYAVELIDDIILERADTNPEQRKNSFFVQKTPYRPFPHHLSGRPVARHPRRD